MGTGRELLEKLRLRLATAALENQRGLLIQPGAIGDCILSLPLAEHMRERARLGGLDVAGRTDYIGYLPGRSCIDNIISMEALGLHKLFVAREAFASEVDADIIYSLSKYAWIATFLGEPGSNFEENLIFAVNCSRSAEVMTFALKPSAGLRQHVSDYYIDQFDSQSGCEIPVKADAFGHPQILVNPTRADMQLGGELLRSYGAAAARRTAVIQPGSGGRRKCWCIDNFLHVAHDLQRKRFEVVFLLGPTELERLGEDTIGRMADTGIVISNLPLEQVVAILSRADAFIGNDSGITHLAAAMGIRTVGVYGPTNPVVYGPRGLQAKAVKCPPAGFNTRVLPQKQNQIIALIA